MKFRKHYLHFIWYNIRELSLQEGKKSNKNILCWNMVGHFYTSKGKGFPNPKIFQSIFGAKNQPSAFKVTAWHAATCCSFQSLSSGSSAWDPFEWSNIEMQCSHPDHHHWSAHKGYKEWMENKGLRSIVSWVRRYQTTIPELTSPSWITLDK
jgi:hypothetical protein